MHYTRSNKFNCNLLKHTLLFLVPLLCFSQLCQGASLNLDWTANSEEDLAGYKVYYGTLSDNYGPPIDVGNIEEYELSGLNEGVIYYIALTAYDGAQNESEKSDEVSKFVSFPEICTDGIDNDEDGYIDCEDFDCDNLLCNDDDTCTENDICTAGICEGTVIDCDDGNECTRDTCEAGQCISECNAASPDDYCCEDQACILEVACIPIDSDNDGIPDDEDNCPDTSNASQKNSDADSHGDACDNCPYTDNENQIDSDNDGIGDVCKEEDMRLTDGLVVYYPFTEASGDVVYDQSNNGTPMDLTITGSVDWNTLDNGVVMSGGKIGTSGSATKVIDALKATGQSTFEVWIEPDSLAQEGPARIISVGGDPSSQNFVLGQTSENITVRLMHTEKDYKAKPHLWTSDNFITTDLIHLVHTYDSITELLYVNGVPQPPMLGSTGNYSNWDDNDVFNLGNEGTSDRPWYGKIHLVAVYDRALIQEEIEQNFEAGPNDLLLTDSDGDGIYDADDNCPEIPNGPELGTCFNDPGKTGKTCTSHSECGCTGICNLDQNDTDEDEIGDVCDDN